MVCFHEATVARSRRLTYGDRMNIQGSAPLERAYSAISGSIGVTVRGEWGPFGSSSSCDMPRIEFTTPPMRSNGVRNNRNSVRRSDVWGVVSKARR